MTNTKSINNPVYKTFLNITPISLYGCCVGLIKISWVCSGCKYHPVRQLLYSRDISGQWMWSMTSEPHGHFIALIKGGDQEMAVMIQADGKNFNNNNSGEYVLPHPRIQYKIHLNCCNKFFLPSTLAAPLISQLFHTGHFTAPFLQPGCF